MRGRWGLAVPNSRPGGYYSRRIACTPCADKAELVWCRLEGSESCTGKAEFELCTAWWCVSYVDDAGVISMLHSVVLGVTAAAAGLVWRGR